MKHWVVLAVFTALACAGGLGAPAGAAEDITVGIQLFDEGRLAEARQFCESFAREHPGDPAGLFYLGRIAFAEEHYEEAAAWFEKAVRLGDGNSDYHLWLGRAYGHQAERASVLRQPLLARKVKEHFEKAVALNPENLAARYDLMEYYLRAPRLLGGGQEKAREQAEEIAKREGPQERPRNEQGGGDAGGVFTQTHPH